MLWNYLEDFLNDCSQAIPILWERSGRAIPISDIPEAQFTPTDCWTLWLSSRLADSILSTTTNRLTQSHMLTISVTRTGNLTFHSIEFFWKAVFLAFAWSLVVLVLDLLCHSCLGLWITASETLDASLSEWSRDVWWSCPFASFADIRMHGIIVFTIYTECIPG